MTKIMSAEEWVDKTYGTDLDPKDREILALLAPQPAWVKTAMHNFCKRTIDGVPLEQLAAGIPSDQLQEMFQEELAAAKAAAGVVVH